MPNGVPMLSLDLFHSEPTMPVEAGHVLLAQGEAGDAMYVVASGRFAIRVNDQTIEEVPPGGVVGEMALIDHQGRSAEVVALEPSTVVKVDEKRFLFLVQNHPYFAIDMMRIVVARLRHADSIIAHTG